MNKKNIESLLAKRPDFIVCTCFEVTCHQLIKAIDNGSNSLDKLIDEFGVTTGCSTCLPDIKELLTELN